MWLEFDVAIRNLHRQVVLMAGLGGKAKTKGEKHSRSRGHVDYITNKSLGVPRAANSWTILANDGIQANEGIQVKISIQVHEDIQANEGIQVV